MSSPGPSTIGPSGGPLDSPHAPRKDDASRRFGRALGRVVVTLLAVGVLVLAAGFVWFVRAVANEEVALGRSADGIVVLTGGASRIADAIDLLAAGHGKRLLITGAHKTTNRKEIARLVPHHARLVACCVDLDHSALNTLGNAAETRRWVKEREFRSLIVVTSSYHMPRSMAELARQLPTIELVPFPVVSDKMRNEPWWSSAATAKLLMSEYLKFVAVQVRMRLEPADDGTDVARARGGAKG
jgi:uncharacterized SAM-binding protein YcdF (DUF218 family)